jgi:hypothetical protein
MVAAPGDNIVVTDDPAAPPVTGFARYVLTGDPVDHGTWVSIAALRTDTSGSTAPPANGTRLRVMLGYATLVPGGVTVYSGPAEPSSPQPGDVWVVTA